MRGKYLYLCVLLTITFRFGYSQDKEPVKVNVDDKKVNQLIFGADDSYKNEEYYLAALNYSQILDMDPDNIYVNYQLAESYRHYFEYDQAEIWYAKTLELDKKNQYPLAPYWYAYMLKMNGKYEDAEKSFEVFLSSFVPQTPEEEIYMDYALLDYNGCVLAIDEGKKPLRNYDFENLGDHVNTGSLEYAPAIIDNDSMIVVTSTREGSKGDEADNIFGEQFSDLYRFEFTNKKWHILHGVHDHFDVVNTDRNDGSGCYSNDKKKFYYTICGEETKGECAIYVSYKEHEKWQAPTRLNDNVNLPGFWNAQPTLSSSDDTLYFVSKRPGGFGMHDIWFSTKTSGEMWGEATNLGDKVNTPFIDMCPDFHNETNSLFFASNGHEGFGGLDIFRAKTITDNVYNMGLPFNSNRDDFYFVMGKNKGYLASNREGGIGHDDIYWFNYKSYETVLVELNRDTSYQTIDIQGTILQAETREPLENVNIILTDSDGLEIKIATTDKDGTFRFKNISSMENYLIKLQEINPNLTDEIKVILDQIRVKKSDAPLQKAIFENIYFDFDKYNIRSEAAKTLDLLIDFQKRNPETQIELKASTDNFGSDAYNAELSKKRGIEAWQYLIKKGYPKSAIVVSSLGEGSPIATNENPIGRQLNRRVEFYVLGDNHLNSDYMTYIVEPNVSFKDVCDMFGMTAQELKDANGLKNQKIETWRPLRVKRGSVLDMIAPATKEATATLSYSKYNKIVDVIPGLVADSANPNRKPDKIIVLKAGESNPEAGIFVNRFELQNSYNLRNNHLVVAQEGEEIYIVKPLDTLAKISKEFGMTVASLKQINGLNSNKIQIGQRLRVVKKK